MSSESSELSESSEYKASLKLFTKACRSGDIKAVKRLIADTIFDQQEIIFGLNDAVAFDKMKLACVLLDNIEFTSDNYYVIMEIVGVRSDLDDDIIEKILDRCKPITQEIADFIREKSKYYRIIVNGVVGKDKPLPHIFADLTEKELVGKMREGSKTDRVYAHEEIERRIAAT